MDALLAPLYRNMRLLSLMLMRRIRESLLVINILSSFAGTPGIASIPVILRAFFDVRLLNRKVTCVLYLSPCVSYIKHWPVCEPAQTVLPSSVIPTAVTISPFGTSFQNATFLSGTDHNLILPSSDPERKNLSS